MFTNYRNKIIIANYCGTELIMRRSVYCIQLYDVENCFIIHEYANNAFHEIWVLKTKM